MRRETVNDNSHSPPFKDRACCRLCFWTICFFVAVLQPLSAQSASFSAALDRSTISIGESATLTLTFQGVDPSTVPTIEAPPNLLIQYIRTGRQITMQNLKTTSSRTFDYRVTPQQPGEYVIPAIQAQAGGRTHATQPIELRVLKAGAESKRNDGAPAQAFLRVNVPRETAFVGEAFPIEILLFVTSGQDVQMPQLRGEGFLFGKLSQPMQAMEVIGSQSYNVLTFRTWAMAVKTGQLTIGPVQCSFTLLVPAAAPSRGGFFDEFFSMGPRIQAKPVTLASDPRQVEVLPLPLENQPPDFSGAVGNYSIATHASPTALAAGDPVTLQVQIAGQGHLESLAFPGELDWSGFQIYPTASKIESTDQLGLAGVKTFERVVIPQNPKVKVVPAISFSFFDPDQKTYRTVRSEPIQIAVAPAATPPQPAVFKSAADEPAVAHGMAHIKPHLGAITPLQPLLVRQRWFLLLQTVPLAICLAAVLRRMRRERVESNPRLRRRLRVAEIVRRGIRQLSVLAQENRKDEFFASLFRLLQEQLGERLNLPSSAITEAVLEERLHGRAPGDLVMELHELFQVCNQARYAPLRSSRELMELVPRTEAALRDLAQLPDVNAK
jgi:hypothetical protein